MRRFPLLRDHKQSQVSPPPDQAFDPGRVRRRDDIIEGTFVWPYDAAFRPLIGIYADGRLQQLGTTFRRPFHERRSWPCCFSIELNEALADRQDLTIAVFETGDILQAPPRHEQALHTVEDLIEDAQRQARTFAYGGFVSFLLLPLNDQIEIICHDLLDRNASVKEIGHYRRKVIDGEFSILGVRDDIAVSEEAEETLADLTLQERRGRACLWQGLEEALGFIVPPPLAREDVVFDAPPSLRSAFEEILVPSEVHSILAFNAVGETSDIGAYGQWSKANQDTVAAVEQRVSRSLDLRRQQAPRSKRYRLGNLLAAMKLGAAATRLADGAVKVKAGATGTIVYGPYMPLEPGHHAAIFSLRKETSEALCLRLEVVHGDILFAHGELRLDAPGQATYRLAFTVPAGNRELLCKSKFEFRLSTDGAAEIICDAVMLEVGEDADVAKIAHPSVANWLALLTTEAAGWRSDDGTLQGLSPSGRVFFGPYYKLLPGRYALTFDYRTETGGEVELEVAAGTDNVLVRRRFPLLPGGAPEALRFEIAEADVADELAGPIEFRLWKTSGFDFRCLALWLTAIGEDVT